MDDESLNCAEHVYRVKTEGALRAGKALLLCAYILFPLAFFLVVYITRWIPIFAVMPIFEWMLVYFTWGLVSYEIRYTFEHGDVTFSRVRGKKKKGKVLLSLRMRDTLFVGGTNTAAAKEFLDTGCPTLDLRSSKAVDGYAIVYEEKGSRRAVLFDGIAPMKKLFTAFSKNHCFDK